MARSAGSKSGLRSRPRPSLLLLDEPLAGMSPRERVETVQLLKSISRGRTMIIIDHDMDSLFELAERVTVLQEGRVLVEGTPDEIKGNATVQEAYLGGVHGVAANEPARGQRAEQLLRRQPHPLRRLVARRAQRSGGAARPQRRRQEHDAEKPDGRGDAAHRLGRCSTAPRSPGRRATRSRRPACSWCTRSAASSAASTSRKTSSLPA